MKDEVQIQIEQAKETLKNYKQVGRKIENDRLSAQAQLNQLYQHEKEILEQCKSLGYHSVDELGDAISDKMAQLHETLATLNRILQGEVLTYEQVQAEQAAPSQKLANEAVILPQLEDRTTCEEVVSTSPTASFDFFQQPPATSFHFNTEEPSKTENATFDFNALFNHPMFSEGE